MLVSTGKESSTVYLLESGWVARTRTTENGRRQIIVVFLPGDLMGLKSMLLEQQPDTIECLTNARVRTIDHKRCGNWSRSIMLSVCGSCSSSPKTSGGCTTG